MKVSQESKANLVLMGIFLGVIIGAIFLSV
jgi:hypothetical protein